MCAIAGFNWDDKDLIVRMMGALKHRGPDSDGQVIFPGGPSLGHDRLAIIDLSPDGAQPMWNADRSLCIVFNGEIYNYKELRAGLGNAYPFRTKSDTEVILALYGKEGPASFSKLNGIFAFAIWDVKKREMVLARDPGGVKPLYYFHDGKRFAFASEAKALLEIAGGAVLDREVLPLYLGLGYVPGERSLFRGIRRLAPGSYATLHEGALMMKAFWDPERTPWRGSREEAVAEIRRVAEASVRRQMLASDRPVGLFLSGGIDSTAMAVLAARQSSESIRTFTTRFDFEMQDNYFNEDADIAARTARRLGARHTEVLVTAKESIDRIDAIAWHLDEPNGNHSAAAAHLLSEVASKAVAVVLSGDGPDEIFGGYDRYHKSRMLSWMRLVPKPLRRAVAASGLAGRFSGKLAVDSDVDQYLELWAVKGIGGYRLRKDPAADREALRAHFRENYFRNDGAAHDFLNLLMETDRRSWLIDEALQRADRLSAGWGIEGRVPWLDDELVRLALRIPSSWKVRKPLARLQQGKRIWTSAVCDLLPEEVLRKEKTGWFSPMAKWLRDPAVDRVIRERLAALPKDVVDPAEAVRLLDDHQTKKGYYLQPLWNLIALSAWLKRFNVRT